MTLGKGVRSLMKVSFVADPFYKNNRIFEEFDHKINRDDSLRPFIELKRMLEAKGVLVATHDIQPIETADVALFLDMPKGKLVSKANRRDYLILFECEVIRPDNWNIKNHAAFDKIFTWNDDLVDNKKYFKLNFSFKFPPLRTVAKEKLITLIAANKMFAHPKELYTARRNAIDWFAQNAPNDFDYYGHGWDRYLWTSNRYIKKASYLWAHHLLGRAEKPCYRGAVESKYDVMQKYKFAICFENARDITGYVTEKIFDCFFAGCVPVYWGANNISNLVDESCYVDFRKFKSYDQLYHFISTMDDKTYRSYLDNIKKYLNGAKAYPYTSDYFVNTLVRNICEAN